MVNWIYSYYLEKNWTPGKSFQQRLLQGHHREFDPFWKRKIPPSPPKKKFPKIPVR